VRELPQLTLHSVVTRGEEHCSVRGRAVNPQTRLVRDVHHLPGRGEREVPYPTGAAVLHENRGSEVRLLEVPVDAHPLGVDDQVGLVAQARQREVLEVGRPALLQARGPAGTRRALRLDAVVVVDLALDLEVGVPTRRRHRGGPRATMRGAAREHERADRHDTRQHRQLAPHCCSSHMDDGLTTTGSGGRDKGHE